MLIDLDARPTQQLVGDIVGISQPTVSDHYKLLNLSPEATLGEVLLAYCSRLREQAAGRGSDGELDLVQERAWLAREQRIQIALKNAVTRKEFAPVGVLSEVLAAASQSVASKLDGLPGLLAKVAPELGVQAREAIASAIARARNDWVADTELLEVKTDPSLLPPEDEPEEILVPEIE